MQTGQNSFIKNSKTNPLTLDPYLQDCFLINNKKKVLKKLSYLKNYPYHLQDKSQIPIALCLSFSYIFFVNISNPRGVALRMHLNRYTNFGVRNIIFGSLGFGFFLGSLYALDRLLIKKNPYSQGALGN